MAAGRFASLFAAAGLEPPEALREWPVALDRLCREYRRDAADAQIVEVERDGRVYLFDLAAARERLVCSYGIGSPLAPAAEPEALDAGLLPRPRPIHLEESDRGRAFRRMERDVAERRGAFSYHVSRYAGDGWIPDEIEYGILRDDGCWWIERFGDDAAEGAAGAATSGSPGEPRRAGCRAGVIASK